MLGNHFEDRNWLLPKNYLTTENKNENVTSVASPRPPLKEEPKMEEQATSPKAKKCRWGPDWPFCKSQRREKKTSSSRSCHQMYQGLKLKDPIFEPEHD